MSMNRPVVLCFSGHDPSGGAGVQADIETLVSHRCHAASVITALTEQDTRNVKKLIPQRPDDIISQADTLLADLPVKAIKIGLIGHHDTAAAIAAVLTRHPRIPVVLDPVLAAGGGAELSTDRLIAAVTDQLLPRTSVLTPNSMEARRLTGLTDLHDCGLALLDKGCEYVLITGTHETSPTVSNQLFHDGRLLETFTWDRLPDSYHGSGCTLASAVAALVAQGLAPFQAVMEAQEYTWNALQAAYRPGQGQHNPNRFFWIDD
ncbi:MAG: hydroxymethylpyrimidine/phosphomethylpyrimidine kinase [Methylobacter sp.]|uniref:bifunctional hydroxymethylpyrimidine kinase/phosphomethylpyrimidine kinase n=1 Tax=Methylobacter sp. TaxID=2051955 RepID=UPI002585302A|nr:hydroxymethylpyrimidine/phosphomethylpyrimidine kinase [Methylobacter sp.]MCL7422898.1 hydroxymethylpyrimidine/phosphomethylpyrimidine kinase [Methylobacter sp.]